MSDDIRPSRTVRVAAGILAVCSVLFAVSYVTSVATRLDIVVSYLQYICFGSALLLPLAFLLYRASKKTPKDRVPWYDFVAAGLSFAIPFYVIVFDEQARLGAWGMFPPLEAVVLGIIMSFLVFEGARRTAGTFFASAVLVLALTPLYVHLLPGILRSLPNSLDRTVGTLFLTSQGMFGSVMKVFLLDYLLFIFFGVAAQVVGAGEFFTNVALAMLGHTRGGPAKVAVIGSSLFGTISGSGAANVMVTGAFTIPMMKQAGYRPYFAAAVESTASTGGIIMPPVMGAVAFIMADFLGMPYWRVAAAAAIPAALYYLCLYAQVHFHAVNNGLRGVPRSELPSMGKTLLEGWHFILVAVLLVFLLFVMKMSPGRSVLFAIVSLFALTALVKKTILPSMKSVVELIESSARVFGQLAAILLAVGLIIGGLSLSGLAMSITQWLGRGEQSVIIALLALAVAAFILGCGMPGSAIYILLAVLMAPALEAMGLNQLAVHLSILYWGLIANFTPPVAIVSYIAAGYAGAPPLKTAIQSMRLAAVIFVAPLYFVYHPVLILEEFQVLPFIITIASAGVGFWLLARGFEGYEPPATWLKQTRRLVSLAASIMLLSMVWYLQIAGAVLVVALYTSGRLIKTPQLST